MFRESFKLLLLTLQKKTCSSKPKPQNILVEKDKIKITNFSSAKEKTDKKREKNVHSPNYASQQRKYLDHVDKYAVYALECMVFQFFVEVPPTLGKCTT